MVVAIVRCAVRRKRNRKAVHVELTGTCELGTGRQRGGELNGAAAGNRGSIELRANRTRAQIGPISALGQHFDWVVQNGRSDTQHYYKRY